MKKRLRKKLRRGEFSEFGFELRFRLEPDLSSEQQDQFLDAIIDFVEARDLGIGGLCGLEYSVFVASFGRGTATEADRVAIQNWLSEQLKLRSEFQNPNRTQPNPRWLDSTRTNTEATNMDREMIDIYSDYLITNFGQATATSLSNVLGGELIHDSITRSLADRELTSKDYWKLVKPIIREIQDENANLSVDDLIVEKPHSEESGVITYYFDHTQGRTVKGMNWNCNSFVNPEIS